MKNEQSCADREKFSRIYRKLIGIWNHGDCAVLLDWRIPIATAVEMMENNIWHARI